MFNYLYNKNKLQNSTLKEKIFLKIEKYNIRKKFIKDETLSSDILFDFIKLGYKYSNNDKVILNLTDYSLVCKFAFVNDSNMSVTFIVLKYGKLIHTIKYTILNSIIDATVIDEINDISLKCIVPSNDLLKNGIIKISKHYMWDIGNYIIERGL